MPAEPSSLAMTVTVWGLKCVNQNILVKSILAIRGHQITLKIYLVSHEFRLCTQPMQSLSPELPSHNSDDFAVILVVSQCPPLDCYRFGPKSHQCSWQVFITVRFQHGRRAAACLPRGDTGKILFTYFSSPVRHIAFGDGSYTVQTAINL